MLEPNNWCCEHNSPAFTSYSNTHSHVFFCFGVLRSSIISLTTAAATACLHHLISIKYDCQSLLFFIMMFLSFLSFVSFQFVSFQCFFLSSFILSLLFFWLLLLLLLSWFLECSKFIFVIYKKKNWKERKKKKREYDSLNETENIEAMSLTWNERRRIKNNVKKKKKIRRQWHRQRRRVTIGIILAGAEWW